MVLKADDRTVAGYCPMGCGQTLILAAGGCVTCCRLECPRPDAVTELLDDPETEHLVDFGAERFTVTHPLREHRDELLTCALHEYISGLDGPPVQPGRYRAIRSGDRWTWQPVAS